MSSAFDTLMHVWSKRVRPLLTDHSLAYAFENLFQEMHSANHDVSNPKSALKGDGVNKDPRVSKAARELEEYDRKLDVEEKKDD